MPSIGETEFGLSDKPTAKANLLPTPRTQMTRKVEVREGGHRSNLEEVIAEWFGDTGKLNPEFVEWMMGYPIGFTDCEDSGTQSSRKLPLK